MTRPGPGHASSGELPRPSAAGSPSVSPAELRRTLGFLARLPIFAGLPMRDLSRLCRSARRMPVGPRQLVMEEGTPGDALYIVLAGELEVTKREDGRDMVLAVRGEGEFVGEMSLLDMGPHSATVRALGDGELLVVGPEAFRELLEGTPGVATTILRTVASRLRSTEGLLVQREKLASLGTLAAGLAHELNNPAAAIRRSADHLRTAFLEWQRWSAELGRLDLDASGVERLKELESAIAHCGSPSSDVLACSREEDRLTEWLEERGLHEAWDVASALAPWGWSVERVAPLVEEFGADRLEAVLRWLAAGLSAQELLEEIDRSAGAISGIVKAVRTYAYLDQAPVQEVDLRESLDDTLVILRHKLKEGVEVRKTYEPELPRIEAWASELNQVWTNLIDNAIHAMDGRGTLELSARRAGENVEVCVTDSGRGIPPEVGERIYEPFFTTKPPGVGSGLGLHIAWGIIVNKHRGRMEYESVPGRTTFRVTLPVRLGEGGSP